jgi:hypothetical protein
VDTCGINVPEKRESRHNILSRKAACVGGQGDRLNRFAERIEAASVRGGAFANTTFPSVSGLSWRIHYSPIDAVILTGDRITLGGATRLENGVFQFSLTEFPAAGWEVQASTNLLEWITVGSNGPFTGSLLFSDTNASLYERRFYRRRLVE